MRFLEWKTSEADLESGWSLLSPEERTYVVDVVLRHLSPAERISFDTWVQSRSAIPLMPERFYLIGLAVSEAAYRRGKGHITSGLMLEVTQDIERGMPVTETLSLI